MSYVEPPQHFVAYWVWGKPGGVESVRQNVDRLLTKDASLRESVQVQTLPVVPKAKAWLAGGAWAGWCNHYKDCMSNARLAKSMDDVGDEGVVRVSVEWCASVPGFTVSVAPLPYPSTGGAEIMEHQGAQLEAMIGSTWEEAAFDPAHFKSLGGVFLSHALANEKISEVLENVFGLEAKQVWLETTLPRVLSGSTKPRM